MYRQIERMLIVCEGPSERAYLQELNRYLNDNEIPLYFAPYPSNGGQFNLVRKKYRETFKNNPRSKIVIWVDIDRYKRNDDGDNDKYQKKKTYIPDFLFSYMNFEDFIAMHLSKENVNKWCKFCSQRNHFTKPSHNHEYIEEFSDFLEIYSELGPYSKGEIPIDIDEQSLNNLKVTQNNKNILLKCDFARIFLEKIEEFKN